MQETQVQSLGWEDPLEESVVTHSSILAWEIPWKEEPGGLHSRGHKESDMTWQLIYHLGNKFIICTLPSTGVLIHV